MKHSIEVATKSPSRNKSLFTTIIILFLFASNSINQAAAATSLTAQPATEISFPTLGGKYYGLELTRDLENPEWTPLPRYYQGDGLTQSYLVKSGSQQLGFFRLAEYDVSSGLVAHYTFDGNANDTSGFNNHGIADGATLVADRYGKPLSAYRFNGTNQRIIIPHQSYLNFPGGEMTISLWVKFNGQNANQYLIGKSDGINFANKWIFYYLQNPNSVSFHVNTTSGAGNSSPAKASWIYNTNDWIHFAVTKSSDTYKTYVNGILMNQSTGPIAIPSTTSSMTIGVAEGVSWVQGDIDDVRIYNRALNTKEVEILKGGNDFDLRNGLIADYRLDGNALDASASAHHGIESSVLPASDRFGNPSRALYFNGTNSVITLPGASAINSLNSDFTISIWAKFDGNKSEKHILGRSNGTFANNKWILIYVPTSDTLSFHAFNVGTYNVFQASTSWSHPTADWYHIAVTKNSTTYTLYINGVKTSQDTGPLNLPSITASFTIGGVEGVNMMKGKLDDLKIYNRVLSEKEIAGLTSLIE